jgi:hypothetical protein
MCVATLRELFFRVTSRITRLAFAPVSTRPRLMLFQVLPYLGLLGFASYVAGFDLGAFIGTALVLVWLGLALAAVIEDRRLGRDELRRRYIDRR